MSNVFLSHLSIFSLSRYTSTSKPKLSGGLLADLLQTAQELMMFEVTSEKIKEPAHPEVKI